MSLKKNYIIRAPNVATDMIVFNNRFQSNVKTLKHAKYKSIFVPSASHHKRSMFFFLDRKSLHENAKNSEQGTLLSYHLYFIFS